MQMLKKIFNSNGKGKYYLELDEVEESQPVQAVVKTAAKVADVVQDKATEVKDKAVEIVDSNPVQQAAETVESTKEVAQEQLQSVTKPEAKTSKKETAKPEAKTSKKETAKSGKKTQKQVKASPKSSGASSFEPPFWVAAMYKNSSTNVNSDGTEAGQTFATDNLMPTITKYRRSPGPSLNKFREMANKAKTPKG